MNLRKKLLSIFLSAAVAACTFVSVPFEAYADGAGDEFVLEQGVITGYAVPLDAEDIDLGGKSPLLTSKDQELVKSRMLALKDEYPEGMSWTNANYYGWKGGIFSGGYGCAGFAFLLSDEAFGDAPARQVSPVKFSDVRIGDILRVNNNTHSVIIIDKSSTGVTLAEGNYNKSIHWGRTMTASEVEKADYMMTRYDPDENPDEPVVITGISVLTKPDKTAYIVGEPLDLTGGIIKVSYSNGTSTNVKMTDVTVSTFYPDQPGSQTLTFTYEGFTTTLTVKVNEVEPTEISFGVMPKTSFYTGDAFTTGSGSLYVTYNNGTHATISMTDPSVTVNSSKFKSDTIGTYTITVKLGKLQLTYDVTVTVDPLSAKVVLKEGGTTGNL